MGNTCRCISQQSQSLSFHTRNHYNPNKTLPQTQKYKIIYDSIATGQPQDRYKQIASYIAECPQLHFVDPNFKYLQPTKNAELQQSRNIRKMYNFSKLKLSKVYEYNHDTPINIFQQRQVELCYLCSVFYFICQANQIKENIFVTTHINPHSAYIIRLFCNGQPCDVIVDEKLPTERQNIKYLSIHQPQEIWPFLLEKAWCKQIGGYDKARGLSPEDCFEEITGLPAYSMWFANRYGPKQVYQAITEALKRKYWIVLTAKSNLISGLKSRQVFYIQKYNQRTQTYKIRSPYTQFTLTNKNIQQKGQVQLTFNEILGYFQFLTIGVYEPGFVTTSYNFKSVKNQQNIFEINVHRPGKANIRVIQFYAEYLSEQEKLRYKYSPILMELYNQQFTLIQKCEGMLENLQGIRCSKLSEEIFIDLQPGVYYLRVQADWESQEHIKSANVVVYSPKNFMTIKKFEGDSIGLAGKLLAFTLEQPTIQIINGENQEVKIRYIQKNYGYIIGIQNLSQNKAQLKISFTQSENIRVNHHSLNGIELDVDLEGRGERVFEVLPQNPRKKYVLSSFDIVKV